MINRYPLSLCPLLIALSLCACNDNSHDTPAPPNSPQITNISAASASIVGQVASFVVTGQHITSTNINIATTNCDNVQIQSLRATELSFTCQPSTYGKQQITIRQDTNKILLNKSFLVDTAATYLLNDTGITACVNDSNLLLTQCEVNEEGKWFVSVQDGAIGRDFLATKSQLTKQGKGNAGFDFSKISATGELLADNSATWSCVLDRRTGLLWEAKTTDGGLHDVNNIYTWYNADDSVNGGFAGNINDGKNTDAFVSAVNQAGLCGYRDWSLPNISQLQSLVDYGHELPAIDTHYFQHTQSDAYWSSSSFSDGLVALVVSFDYGVIRNNAKAHRFSNTEYPVRLVRSAPLSH